MKTFSLWLVLVPLLASCSHVNSRIAPNTNLRAFKHPFVQHLLTDGRGIDQIIAQELRKMGYDASAGPTTLMPRNADLLVTYQDRWTFDFTTYMIEIDLQVETARTGKLLAESAYFRPSITGESPVEMIDVALKKIFTPHVPPVPLTPAAVEPGPGQ